MDPVTRVVFYGIGVFLLLFSVWFFYDGFRGWPQENQRGEELMRQKAVAEESNQPDKVAEVAAQLAQLKRHTAIDIQIQKVVGVIMLVLSICALAYATRGGKRRMT
jgi:hypothetical protein